MSNWMECLEKRVKQVGCVASTEAQEKVNRVVWLI